MQLKKTWIEKLMGMTPEECMPLEDTPQASVYSAIQYNKKVLNEKGMKFKIQPNDNGEKYVCRVK